MRKIFFGLFFSGSALAAPSSPLLDSPWPKFRADLAQTGRTAILPTVSDKKPWAYKTSKGIFSSPVIGPQGEVYIGSADRNFYAFSEDGEVLWKVATGEIIDSSALLDAKGRLYFGSGDGILRAHDRETGTPVWEFEAEDPTKTGGIINWFEGNVTIGLDGTLYVPNDNFRLYAIDSNTGAKDWHFPLNDQIWSAPAVDPDTGNLFFGHNYVAPLAIINTFWKNIFALDPKGKLLWRQAVQASVVASPLLSREGLLVVGSFDGTLYAYEKATGKVRWTFKTQDHIYASPSEQADGTVIQASTDGHVYALDGKTGSLKWSFAAGDPIRSSPALDGQGNIYFGSGDGALYVLNSDGSLRYRMQLIQEDRNDLNGSPALSATSVVIAGENGEIWSVPYDYCLRPDGRADRRCTTRHTEPSDGPTVSFVTPFGSLSSKLEGGLSATQAIKLSIQGHEQGRPVATIFDEASISIESEPAIEIDRYVTGDGKTLILNPKTFWPRGEVKIKAQLAYKFQNAKGSLAKDIRFEVGTKQEFALSGTDVFALRRLAVPVPTVMPSYNQIGFDSLSYVVRVLEKRDGEGTALVMAGLEDNDGRVRVDPKGDANFVLAWRENEDGLLLENRGGFSATAMNLNIPFSNFRLSHISTDAASGTSVFGAFASAICREIPTYGYFLNNLGYCSAKEGRLTVAGAAEIKPLPEATSQANEKLSWQGSKTWLNYATIEAVIDEPGDELYSLVLIDAETLLPIELDYKKVTKTMAGGKLRVSLTYASGPKMIKSFLLKNEAIVSTQVWKINAKGVYEKGK